MSISLGRHTRDITLAGFTGEPDPNVTSPTAGTVFKLEKRNESSGNSSGHILVGRFDTEEASGVANYQTWFQDSSSGQWFRLPADTLTHRLAKITKAISQADVFVQILGFTNSGNASKFTLSAVEL